MDLPAGLIDSNLEIFDFNGNAFVLFNGKKSHYSELPSNILDFFMQEMLMNTEVMICLNKMGMEKTSEMLEQYLICRYGSFDANPDLDVNTMQSNTEYHDCGHRDECPYQFILCDRVKIKVKDSDVILTRREIEVTKQIAYGLTDKEIADNLSISIDTLRAHSKNIYTKLSIQSRAQLTAIAIRNNLIK